MKLHKFLSHLLETHAQVLKLPDISGHTHEIEPQAEEALRELHSESSMDDSEDPYTALESLVRTCQLSEELEERLWSYPFYRACIENHELLSQIDPILASELAYHYAEAWLKGLRLAHETYEIAISYWRFFRRRMLGKKALRLF